MFVINPLSLKNNYPYILITGFILLCITVVTPSLHASSELALLPSSRIESGGYIEFGTFIDQSKATLNDTTIDVPIVSFFTRIGLSKNLEYNLKVRHDMQTLHNFNVAMLRFNTNNDSVTHFFGGGFKNVGWQHPDSSELTIDEQFKSINIPIVSGYINYAMSSTDGDSGIHFGLASDSTRSGVMLGIGGIEKNFVFGRLMIEWDGKTPHIGFKYAIRNYRLYFAYALGSSKDATDKVQTQQFSIGISFAAQLGDEFKHMFATRDEIKNFKGDLSYRMEKLERLIEEDQVLRESKFLENLEESLTKALTDTGEEENKDYSIKRAYSHMQKGLEHYYAGDFKPALNEYNTAVKIIPTSTFGHMRLGSIHYQLQDYEKAKFHWKTALSLEPANVSLREQIESLLTPESINEFEAERLAQELKQDISKLAPDKARRIKVKKLADLFKDFKAK